MVDQGDRLKIVLQGFAIYSVCGFSATCHALPNSTLPLSSTRALFCLEIPFPDDSCIGLYPGGCAFPSYAMDTIECCTDGKAGFGLVSQQWSVASNQENQQLIIFSFKCFLHMLRMLGFLGMTGFGMGAGAAYYLDYQNRRPDYITTFVEELIDWDKVAERYAAAK